MATTTIACGSDKADDDRGRIDRSTVGKLTKAEARSTAKSLNHLGFTVHQRLLEPGTNTVTSPLSLGGLLGLLAPGADGQAEQDLTRQLGLSNGEDPSIGALLAQLGATNAVTLEIANSLWTNTGVNLQDEYSDFVRKVYGAQTASVPLDKQEGADRIDNWVKESTNGKFTEMSKALGLPDPDAVLVLLNAAYFKGNWTTQFDPADTRPGEFKLASGSSVEVPMMSLPDNAKSVETSHAESFSLLRLPYGKDKRYGMEILLPNETVDISEFIKSLDLDDWAKARGDLHEGKAMVVIPKFTSKVDSDLVGPLKAAGLGSIFGGGALPKLTDSGGALTTVAQSVYIAVDEEGTEAAVATGGAVATSAPMPLMVDRPFAFAITDRDTGAMLFLGTINDPTRTR